jgi:hypothetical protein
MSRGMHLLSCFGAALLSRFAAGILGSGLSAVLMICQWGYAAEPPAYPVPASLEMMQLLRDEHGLVTDMVKAQLATERKDLPRRRTVSSTDLDPASNAIVRPQGDGRSVTARNRRTS